MHTLKSKFARFKRRRSDVSSLGNEASGRVESPIHSKSTTTLPESLNNTQLQRSIIAIRKENSLRKLDGAEENNKLIIDGKHNSASSTTDFATPLSCDSDPPILDSAALDGDSINVSTPVNTSTPAPNTPRPKTPRPELPRRQSILPHQQTKLIKTLLDNHDLPTSATEDINYFSTTMVRKLWVKRPNASATLVTVNEGDVVDDVRDYVLKKYANSLGRSFDAPDVTLRIVPRELRQERTLGPEEPISRTLDAYFPGGQTVDEALIIDVPLRRTPKASPHILYVHPDDGRPVEAGSDYFPPMPVPAAPSPHLQHPVNGVAHVQTGYPVAGHAISVLTTGHVPNLPSPGGRRPHGGRERPRIGRQHTSSPTVVGHVSTPTSTMSAINEKSQAPAPPPLPTPPAQETQRVATPPPRVSSPRAGYKKKSSRKKEHPSLPAGLLNRAVPPINVLIVEDNIINSRLLEAFMKKLKVRWQTAMNGKEAVTKWRSGGFHLVLMDIQLPVMSGLEATREIRRLERLNSIGVFSSSASSSAPERDANEEPEGQDKLPSTVLFKSPVIIVALTASSLQSDRHEALAAGCNDFLTKPVNFVWLERKVMEWGCMQALIDFDGWRKWKDFSKISEQNGAEELHKKNAAAANEKKKKEEKKKNRNSFGGAAPGTVGTMGVGAGVAARIAEEAEEKGEEGLVQ